MHHAVWASAPPLPRGPPKCPLTGRRWGGAQHGGPTGWFPQQGRLSPRCAGGGVGASGPGPGGNAGEEGAPRHGRRGEMTRSCRCLSRSHLQPASYGPVLSPMNKAHGGVNKLPSVNQLVGQPPPHGSAAGPNLGPMGEHLGPMGRAWGRAGPRAGWEGSERGPAADAAASLWAVAGCLAPAAAVHGREAQPRTVPLSVPHHGEVRPVLSSQSCRAGEARPDRP